MRFKQLFEFLLFCHTLLIHTKADLLNHKCLFFLLKTQELAILLHTFIDRNGNVLSLHSQLRTHRKGHKVTSHVNKRNRILCTKSYAQRGRLTFSLRDVELNLLSLRVWRCNDFPYRPGSYRLYRHEQRTTNYYSFLNTNCCFLLYTNCTNYTNFYPLHYS
jgi:hypothetical protein